jgi:hypothetical protein
MQVKETPHKLAFKASGSVARIKCIKKAVTAINGAHDINGNQRFTFIETSALSAPPR